MIFISQGYERSISTEILLKSLTLLSQDQCKQICYVGNKDDLLNQAKKLGFNISVSNNQILLLGKTIDFKEANFRDNTPSMSSLLSILEIIKDDDTLVTLPSRKDQFSYQSISYSGHTEFFRAYFAKTDLAMIFRAPNFPKLLLLSDHIPLKDVAPFLKSEMIISKVTSFLNAFPDTKKVYFCGLNPHAGEGGILGDEEKEIEIAIKALKTPFKSFEFIGPIGSDSLFLNQLTSDDLLVSCYHDQILGTFKYRNQFIGLQETLNLPFKRLSVDHGTGENIFGKNIADYRGLNYVLHSACK